MFKNLLKISLRRLVKNKIYTVINLFGLAMGFASVLIIFLFVRKEQSFDKFHDSSEQIFRILKTTESENGSERSAGINAAIIPFISDVIPSVKYATRYFSGGSFIYSDSLTFNNEGVKLRFLRVDTDFFKVFTFELLEGRYPDFLANPNAVVITKSKAEAIFGDHMSALGESIITVGNQFEIVGILKDLPIESSIKFDVANSLVEANKRFPFMLKNWDLSWTNSVVRFDYGTTPDQQTELLASIGKEYHAQVPNSENTSFVLQALGNMHFDVQLSDRISGKIDRIYLMIFSVIAFTILISSVVNYCALTLAQSVERVKEIGMRRTLGARRSGLIMNFFSESVLLTSIAFVLGLILAEFLLPKLESLLNRELGIHLFSHLSVLVWAYVLVVTIALISVVFPALVMSKKSLTGLRNSNPGQLFSKSVFIELVNGFQVAVFLFLIASTLYVNKQFNFIQDENLGFDKENVLIVNVNTNESIFKKEGLKDEFGKSPYVRSLSLTTSYPSSNGRNHFSERHNINYFEYQIEPEYFDVFGLTLLEGRLFENFDHSKGYVVINETAAKGIGDDTAIGKKIGGREIIGVVKDFHTESKREPMRPLALRLFDSDGFGLLVLKLKGSETKAALNDLHSKYEKVTGSTKLKYTFLEERYGRIYSNEKVALKMMSVFTTLALVIAIMGMLGTTSYSVQRRIKEISIRKVLGANIVELIKAINSKTFHIILLGACIALPLSHLWISGWLSGFAYHIETSYVGYMLIFLLSMILIVPTLALQTLKVYHSKTVDYLKEN